MSLQYLKKEVRDEVFCMQINIKVFYKLFQHFGYQSFLQGDTIIIDKHDQVSQSTQCSKFAIFLQYLRKDVRHVEQ